MENLIDRLEEIYGQKSWIIAIAAAVGAGPWHSKLRDWSAETLVVASNEGTGELPDTAIVYTGSKSDSVVGSIRAFFDSVENPDFEVLAAVNEFDPQCEARVIAEPYATASMMVGRRTFGVRRPEWSAWEDKMRVDALWDELDIPRAPHRIVSVADAPEVASELSNENGSVWVADNSRGWHGGGDYVKWVASTREVSEAVAWFSSRAKRVRVMPFLDGLPCSIHGWATTGGVAVFLPVEILILRDVANHRLVYSGVSSWWEAPPRLTSDMREVALKVGNALHERDGYIGPFGIDGVATIDGFRPTELNPRMSAGAGVQLGSVEVPVGALMRAEIEGLIDVDHRWLESAAIEQRRPVLHFGKMVTKEIRESVGVAFSGSGAIVECQSEKARVGTVTAGPSATGSYITGEFDPNKVGVGKSAAPLIASALNMVSARWGLELPIVSPAPDLDL